MVDLCERGESPRSVTVFLETVADFVHWSARQRVGLAEIDEAVVSCPLNRHPPVYRCAAPVRRTHFMAVWA